MSLKKLALISTVVLSMSSAVVAHAAESVKGYLIAHYDVVNEAVYQKYLAAANPIVPKFGGKAIIFDRSINAVEGTPAPVTVIVEFPSPEKAEAFYNSAEYSAIRHLRKESTTNGTLIRTEGLPPMPQ